MATTGEGSKNQIGEGGVSSPPTTAKEPQGALSSSVSRPPATTETTIARRPAAPAHTISEAEEGHATARKESVEQCRKAKVKSHLELGGLAAIFGFAVLSGSLCLPKEAERPNNVRFTLSLLLAFATFLSGKALMVLSMNMLGLPENLVSGGQRVVSKCLIGLCTVLPVMTLVSLLALLPSMLYLCLGLAVITVVVLLVLATYCYLRWRADRRDKAAAWDTPFDPKVCFDTDEERGLIGVGPSSATDEEHKEELDAASKITSCATNSAFAGLVGVVFSASKSNQGLSATTAVYAAIFFMFSTAIFGMLMMVVSKNVSKVPKRWLKRFLVSAIRLANAFLLCLLACAAFAASFAVIGCQFFASFTPLAITGVVYFTVQHCTVSRGHAGLRNRENEEARLKAMEDIATKVAAASMGAIMSVLAVSVGETRGEKTGSTNLFMAVLTSTFVSSFGVMLLAAVPSSTRACLDPISKLLVWTSVALFAAAAVSVFGAEVFMAASQ